MAPAAQDCQDRRRRKGQRQADRQVVRRADRPLGTVAPALVLGDLAVVVGLLLAQLLAPVEIGNFVPLVLFLPLFVSATLFPVAWPLVRPAAGWRRRRASAGPGERHVPDPPPVDRSGCAV